MGAMPIWTERTYSKSIVPLHEFFDKVAPTIFCTWFGLLSIQKRALPLDRDLTKEEDDYFMHLTSDRKKENFGYLNGRIVCVDYA
jgi:hypothetical protein